MLRFGDVSKCDCGSCVFCRGLITLVGILSSWNISRTLTDWMFVDVSICDAFYAELVDSGVVNLLAFLSFIWLSSLRFSFWF